MLGLIGTHALALTVLAYCELPAGVGAVAMLLVCYSGGCDLLKFGNNPAGRGIRQLIVNQNGPWRVMTADGRQRTGHPRSLILIHPWAITFTLTTQDGGSEPVLVLPDMTDPAGFHALRLWLRLHPGGAEMLTRR